MSDETNNRNIVSIHADQKALREIVNTNTKTIADLQAANFQLTVALADLRQQFNLFRAQSNGTGATTK